MKQTISGGDAERWQFGQMEEKNRTQYFSFHSPKNSPSLISRMMVRVVRNGGRLEERASEKTRQAPSKTHKGKRASGLAIRAKRGGKTGIEEARLSKREAVEPGASKTR